MHGGLAGKQQGHAGEECGDQPGLDQHLARLPFELAREPGILHALDPPVGLALTARRKAHSRVVTGLEQAERARQERHEEPEPDAAVGAGEQEQQSGGEPESQQRGTADQPLPAARRSDVPRDRRQ